MKRRLRQVKCLWPGCPAVVSGDGQYLVVSSSRNSPAICQSDKPAPLMTNGY
jgi:hypothetical protein